MTGHDGGNGYDDPVIERVTAAVYEIPTGQREGDGTLAWSKTVLVTVTVTGGQTGTGYTYATGACKTLIDDVLAAAVTGKPALDIAAAWESMVRAIRNMGRPGVASCAISAVDTALWDLKGILLGVPVSRLPGKARDEVPVYGSSVFTTDDEHTARSRIEQWTGEWGASGVKIKIGESWGTCPDHDLSRVAFARKLIGPAADLLVDANGGYTRKQAIRLARAMDDYGVSWFEEPVSSDDLAGLREIRDQVDADVTAGEYGYDLAYFTRMIDAGAVDCVQADVTRCGGITEFLRVAAVTAGHGLEISPHCAPALHTQLCLALPNLRHLEFFHDHVRIESMLFDGALLPHDGVLRPDPSRPGLGLTLKTADADQFRTA